MQFWWWRLCRENESCDVDCPLEETAATSAASGSSADDSSLCLFGRRGGGGGMRRASMSLVMTIAAIGERMVVRQ